MDVILTQYEYQIICLFVFLTQRTTFDKTNDSEHTLDSVITRLTR